VIIAKSLIFILSA